MTHTDALAPSPVRAGFVHGLASLTFFAALTGALAAGIHLTGDPAEAGPRETVALFEKRDGDLPDLKTRLAVRQAPLLTASVQPNPKVRPTRPEPSLNVPDPLPSRAQGAAPDVPEGVRINGKLVPLGQSLSTVESKTVLPKAPISGLYERGAGGRLPKIAGDGRRPEIAYARPFENVDGRPTVSIVLGGLGINGRITRAAIAELPPEVTLSFVPHARGLNTLVAQARKAGHEVLIELPMEAYDKGRSKQHPHTLTLAAGPETNLTRLQRLLASTVGYYGVTNYKGAKFSSELSQTRPVFQELVSRGVSFVENGRMADATFQAAAELTGVSYARAGTIIDLSAQGDAIESQLFALESQARRQGQALGSGFAYPVTIDVLKSWSASLPQKGLTLAPASSLQASWPTPPVPQKSAAIGLALGGGAP